jgi:hypothetical protein
MRTRDEIRALQREYRRIARLRGKAAANAWRDAQIQRDFDAAEVALDAREYRRMKER